MTAADLEQRRAEAPPQIDDATLPAGSPMHYYCKACKHLTAIKPELWVDDPPPRYCDWCVWHGYDDGMHNAAIR